METDPQAPLNPDPLWGAFKHCAPFTDSFKACDTKVCDANSVRESSKFTLNLSDKSAETASDLREKHESSVCTKWVGKNSVTSEDDVRQMHICIEEAFPLIAPLRAQHKYNFLVSEGDVKEDSSCFMTGLWEDIKKSIEDERLGGGSKVYVLVVRGEQDTFSKLFVQAWLDLIKEMNIADRVFFAVLGERGDNKSKSDFTYGLSNVIVNIGSTYKDAGFRYNVDSNGKIKVHADGKRDPTAGFRELCSLIATPGVEELFIADKPKGLCVLTHARHHTSAEAKKALCEALRVTPVEP